MAVRTSRAETSARGKPAVNGPRKRPPPTLPKCPSGIQGLDEITAGGLPRGRPTLVCGNAGCGKTLFGVEFLVRGATEFNEPGLYVAFEETAEELAQNVSSLGFDLPRLVRQGKLLVEHIRIERNEIEETGEYNLDGLFVRLGLAVEAVGAKRVVLDTLETLFSALPNEAILRAELRRLFRWLKERKLTAIITAESGTNTLTRYGLEEYVSDCVILLDHRVSDQMATRRLRIVKYRGSTHGTNEYPFLIDESGFQVVPITSMSLDHPASHKRIPTGVPQLDEMLGGQGLYRGSSVLISGTAGTGKTSLSAQLASSTCRRGERCLYFAFEEARDQIVRNMQSIGIDLAPWLKKGLLQIRASRPTLCGLETHLASMYKACRDFRPHMVVMDPISGFTDMGAAEEVKALLVRLIDFLKKDQVTTVLTNLTHAGKYQEQTETRIASLMDIWILLRDIELGGERNRALYILKARGMAHSNQIREFRMTTHGIELLKAYLGPEGVQTGSARLSQEAHEKAAALMRHQEIERQQRELERKRQVMEDQIAALRSEFAAAEEELRLTTLEGEAREQRFALDREEMAQSRRASN